MTRFRDINLRVFRSIKGLEKELGKLSELLEEDDNLTLGFDLYDTEEYIDIKKVMQTINLVNKDMQSVSGDIGKSMIKFLALMKLYKAYEIVPDEFLYKDLYQKRVWEHDIEIGSSWDSSVLELIKFKKSSRKSEGGEVDYLFAGEKKKTDQKRSIQFGFNSCGCIIIKNADHFATDTSDFKIIAFDDMIIITKADTLIPNYKVVDIGEDVVKSTRYDSFETVDYHTL